MITKYTHRFIARVIIEANSPIAIGKGEKDIVSDSLVIKDMNGLPYIPGTALAGVTRSLCPKNLVNKIFGDNGDNGTGSEIIFSEAKLIGRNGKVIDGIIQTTDKYLRIFDTLPIRQHVNINTHGSATNSGKYDNQIVFKGTRFCFEIEMISDGNNLNTFLEILERLHSPFFRIGGGTRNGFGEIKVIECIYKDIDLTKEDDLRFYLNKSSDLSQSWEGIVFSPTQSDHSLYELKIHPIDFFSFGSGFGDNDADNTPVQERVIKWDHSGNPIIQSEYLIPGTSIKGAVRHRTIYHYNKISGRFTDMTFNNDTIKSTETIIRCLFGYEGNKEEKAIPGNIFVSDTYLSPIQTNTMVFPHVKIDRFTSAPIDGALFHEKVTHYSEENDISISFSLDDSKLKKRLADINLEHEERNLINAFENALIDICKGLLPLGGSVNKGHGRFQGKLMKGDLIIYQPNEL